MSASQEERLHKLEHRIIFLGGVAATLTICCLAFLGYEYWRIPGYVQGEVDKHIDTEVQAKIQRAAEWADKVEGRDLKLKRLAIVDDNGVTRIRLFVAGDNPYLQMYDSAGSKRLDIRLTEDRPWAYWFRDEGGQQKLWYQE